MLYNINHLLHCETLYKQMPTYNCQYLQLLYYIRLFEILHPSR
uniref:Uncharacterized protein n=1 Tax=Meloidogyne enterolobii TaxID=390850 RepID=A0A6V7WUH5_MELEN|nr:unnamed protein product [Meloidogyne enterolobii]